MKVDLDTINTLLIDLPGSIRGFSRENPDGTYTIVLNSSLCRECQEATYWHEIEHIENGDFTQCCVSDIEVDRHRIDFMSDSFSRKY